MCVKIKSHDTFAFSLSAVSLAQNTRREAHLRPSTAHLPKLSFYFIYFIDYDLNCFRCLKCCIFRLSDSIPHFISSSTSHVFAVSKCLTLLIEIYPINNTKVLKAVDCRVKVQVECVCMCVLSFPLSCRFLLQPGADVAVMKHQSLQCVFIVQAC